MSSIANSVWPYFETLSTELKSEIMNRDVELLCLTDLVQCLETISEEL